jgi:hypothetical protein
MLKVVSGAQRERVDTNFTNAHELSQPQAMMTSEIKSAGLF